jgi:hypothetical protein
MLRYLDSNNNDPETSINKDQHGNAEIGIQLINATTNDDESHLKIYFESLGAQYWQLFREKIEFPDIEMAVLLNRSKASCLGKWNYTVKKFFWR